MNFLMGLAKLLIEWKWLLLLAPAAVAGASSMRAVHAENKEPWIRLAALGAAVPIASWLLWDWAILPNFQVQAWPASTLLYSVLAASIGAAAMLFWARVATPTTEKIADRLTKKTGLERNQKTDVRFINQFLPSPVGEFDPLKHWRAEGFFLGLDAQKKPISWTHGTLPHVQVAGTTGAGKGVVLSMLAGQCLVKGEAVFFLDPKFDEWAPSVLAHVASEAEKPFHFVDLRPGAGSQLNPLSGATADEIYELFLAGFSLSEKGTDADFYRLADRQSAKRMAIAAAAGGGLTAAKLLTQFGEELRQTAPGFAGHLQEMAELPAVNAAGKAGLDLEKIVAEGGAVYIVGSMRNAAVLRMQRMLLVKLIQLAERRDRTAGAPRQVAIVLDELKYHISRPALEALGAARDKGVHLVLAHQSLADLRDCPADLNADAVTGAVMENGKIKLVYRVEDPDTAEWLARKSGIIQADTEVRRVTRGAGLVETVDPERQIREAETYLIDTNQILNLHPGQAVLYGAGLPKFIHTSPIKCEKTKLTPKIVKGDAPPNPAAMIDPDERKLAVAEAAGRI